MKLEFRRFLPEVEIVTDSEHGEIEEVYFDGEPVADMSVADFVMMAIGENAWRGIICVQTDLAREALLEQKEIIR